MQSDELLLDYIDAKLGMQQGPEKKWPIQICIEFNLFSRKKAGKASSHFISALLWLNLPTKDDEWNPGYIV